MRASQRSSGSVTSAPATVTRAGPTGSTKPQPTEPQALSLGTHAIATLTGTVSSALGVADLTRVVDGMASYR
jgi:hypothetical protein